MAKCSGDRSVVRMEMLLEELFLSLASVCLSKEGLSFETRGGWLCSSALGCMSITKYGGPHARHRKCIGLH